MIFQENFGYNLSRREIDVDEYYNAMQTLKTSGLDITVLVLCHLLKVKALILVRDFIWKSIEADINDFDVLLMLFTSGRFVSASPRNKKRIQMEVPVFARPFIQPSPINVIIGEVPQLPSETSVQSTKQTVEKADSMDLVTDKFSGTLIPKYCHIQRNAICRMLFELSMYTRD